MESSGKPHASENERLLKDHIKKTMSFDLGFNGLTQRIH